MKGRCNREDIDRINEVKTRAEDAPVYIYAGAKPIERVAAELNVTIRSEAIDILVFDYLQEFQTNKRHQDERTRFKHTSSVMRTLVRSNGKTGIILSQLTMTTETKVPNKQNIRESRDVGNAAEVIVIGFSPEADIKPANAEPGSEPIYRLGRKYLIVDKNKGGPAKRKIELKWNTRSACFDTVKDPEQERLEAEAARLEAINNPKEFFWDN